MAKTEAVTFFQSGLPAVTWDKKRDAPKYVFEKRFLTTSDPKTIKLLDGLGYHRWKPEDVPKGWTKDGNIQGASVAHLPAKTTPESNNETGDDTDGNGEGGGEGNDTDSDGEKRFTAGE